MERYFHVKSAALSLGGVLPGKTDFTDHYFNAAVKSQRYSLMEITLRPRFILALFPPSPSPDLD
jgi:hypothetical protein